MKKIIAISLLAIVLASGLGAHAGPEGENANFLTKGEIRKIDPDTGRVTLRHGPIENLNMPGMTMIFQAVPAEQLSDLQAGDKVRFRASKNNGNFIVTDIEKTQ
jgi:Cu/Ag efflux protein CusF